MQIPDRPTLETATMVQVDDLWALTAVAMRFHQLNPDHDPAEIHGQLALIVGKMQRILEEHSITFPPPARFETPRLADRPPTARGQRGYLDRPPPYPPDIDLRPPSIPPGFPPPPSLPPPPADYRERDLGDGGPRYPFEEL